MKQSYTVTVEQDETTKELYFPIPVELSEQLGWLIGDTINYKDNEDGSFTMTNVSKEERDMPLFIVETVVTHRVRYAVRAKSEEHANDTVVMEEAEEFDQNYLGDQIFSTRQVTAEEYLKSFESGLTDEMKMRLIHKVKY